MTTDDDLGSRPMNSEFEGESEENSAPDEESQATSALASESEATDAVPESPESLHQETLAQILQVDGIVMLIGGTDTGKTTFCAAAAKAALASGRRIAILDADSGQSEIGPPATLGLAVPEADFIRLSEMKPKALHFVGTTTPYGYASEWAIGTRRLADRAREAGAETILVDMPGMVTGAAGFQLHRAVAASLRPSAVALFERESELRDFRRGISTGRVFRPAIPSAVHEKTKTVRALRRSRRFADYFQDSREWDLSADSRFILGGSLFLGRPLRPAVMEELRRGMKSPPVYVERGPDGVRAICSEAVSNADREFLAKRFDPQRVHCLDASQLTGLTVGLLDESGETLAMGIVKRVHFRRRSLRILTPWLNQTAIQGFAWGAARVSPAGKEFSPLRPGEI